MLYDTSYLDRPAIAINPKAVLVCFDRFHVSTQSRRDVVWAAPPFLWWEYLLEPSQKKSKEGTCPSKESSRKVWYLGGYRL